MRLLHELLGKLDEGLLGNDRSDLELLLEGEAVGKTRQYPRIVGFHDEERDMLRSPREHRMDLDTQLASELLSILQRFDQAGHKFHVVSGAVVLRVRGSDMK